MTTTSSPQWRQRIYLDARTETKTVGWPAS